MTNNNQDVVKLYAAFRSGCLGENILDVYFPFFANILIENNVNVVDENELKNKFEQKYNILVLVNFVRQVLGVGVINGSITNVRCSFSNRSSIKAYYGNAKRCDCECL